MKTTVRNETGFHRAKAFRTGLGLLCGLTLCWLPTFTARAALSQTMVQQFYVPLPEANLQTALKAIDTTGTAVGNVFKSTISITVGATNTIIVYDHWEDGYENDINNPSQSTTQIWGDGNDSNGICPGFLHDPTGLSPGTVIILTNDVTLPRNPATVVYDGRDRITASKAIVVTRVAWGVVPGTVLMSGSEVYDTTRWGTSFETPVGTNTVPTIQSFSYSSLFIMASQNGTVVTVDTNGDGTTDLTATLNQGDNYFVNGGVQSGATITASKPVQVDEVTGRIGSTYQSRTFAIRPTDQWDASYYAPVGTRLASEVHNVFLFNPYATNLVVGCDTRTGTTNVSVPANGTYKFPMPLNSGAHFYTTNSVKFYAVGANDSGGAVTANATHDWGYSLLPESALTTVAVAGWAPGSDDVAAPAGPDGNGSPVWVTPTRPTTIYVNYSGNPASGLYTAPNGQKYDTNFTLTALQSLTIYNPTTKNMSGARLFTVDGATFTAAWGEDSSKAGPGIPYMDVGTTIIPFPVPVILKSAALAVDANHDGQISAGDTMEFTIRVSNLGMLPLGNVLILDPLSASLTYVANSATNNGVRVADNLVPPAGTVFPLDESGLLLDSIAVGGFSEIKYRTLINAGATTFTNYVVGMTSDGTQTNSATVTVVPPGTPTCNMAFSDSSGNTVTTYAANASLYVTITNSSLNTLPGAAETVTVVVKNNSNGDQEFLTLTETGANTGVFRNTAALPSSATSGASLQDGTLYAQGGQTLEVDLFNSICSAAYATVSASSATKKLYLSDPSQALDRVDPVATSDATTATTVAIGASSGSTPGSVTKSVAASSDDAREANNAVNIDSQTMVIDSSSQDWAGFRFTGITIPAGATITSATLELQGDESDSTGSPQVWVYAQKSSNPATFTTANNSIQNRTRTVASVTWPLGNWTPATWYSSPNLATVIQELLTAFGSLNNAPIAIILDNLTSSATRHARTYDFGAASAPKLTINWSASSGPAVSGATFTQSPSFCSGFSMPSGGAVTITSYLASITGTIPANPDVTAVLKYGSTPFIGFGSPTYYSGSSMLVWSGTLSSNVSVSSGQAITFDMTNNATAYSFQIAYDSSSKPSSISLPTTTIISVNSMAFFTSAYPGATLASNPLSGQTLYLRAVISDPFGASDVNYGTLTITDPSAGVTTVTLNSAYLVASDTCTKTFEYPWLAGGTVGSYAFRLDAYEGTEGNTSSGLTNLFVSQLDLGTPSTTEFTYGNNGYSTNSYAANSNVCVRVTDLDQNLNPSAIETVTAIITTSTGDSETITLAETSVNSGIFTGCITANTNAVTPGNGVLNTLPGATLTVTYTDPTDPLDLTSAAATIKPNNPANPAVSVLKTLVSPASGMALVGGTVQYNIQVANSGSVSVPTVLLTDTNLSSQLLFASASVTPNSTGTNGAGVVSNVWNNLGPLGVGATTNITVNFTVLTTGSLTNHAMVTGSATNGPARASVTGYRTGLAVAKWIVSPVPGSASIGNTVVFRIGLTNTGTTTITTLPLEDSYSAGALQYVSSTVTPAGAGGGQILWANLGPLSAGANTTVDVTFTAIGVSSPTANNAAVNYATDSGNDAVPAVQSSTNLTITGGSIGSSVWFDADASGTTNSGDSALSGMIVFIDANNDGIRQSAETFTTTDSTGSYLLSSLAAGTYHVRVDTNSLPSGVLPTYDLDGTGTPDVATVSLGAGQNRTDANFGYTGSGSIGNYVWYDADADGVQDAAESALSGVRVFIDANGNGQWEATELYQTTDANGLYTFNRLIASTYNIAVDYSTLPLPTGSTCTHDRDGTNNGTTTVTLAAGQNVTDADFGFQGNLSLGNWVFEDLDNDGNRDSGEDGISGVVLKLFKASDGNPTGSALATQTTESHGYYRFDGLMPGSYVVVVDLANSSSLAGYVSSTGNSADLTLAGDFKDHGKDTALSGGSVLPGGIASVAVTLGTGLQPTSESVANTTPTGQNGPGGDTNDNLVLDFSFSPTYSIGNRVFSDANNNSTLDGGDGGISGVVMKLFAADGSGNPTGSALASTNTDANGYYRFDGLVTGTYIVVVDMVNSASLSALVTSAGASTVTNLTGDLKDHGLDTPVSVGTVVNGIASTPVTVGPGLQPAGEATGAGAGATGPTGDAGDNLTMDFGFTPAYSVGNRVFRDDGTSGGTANDGVQQANEPGIPNVNLHLYAASSGSPTGAILADTTTDSDGYYRFDGIAAGTYVVVVHVLGSAAALDGLQCSSGVSSDNTISGDLKNHGQNSPLGSSSVLAGGIASYAFTLGDGSQPTGEATGSGAGAHGPNGDSSDNLVIDFGFAPNTQSYSIGNRVFRDDGTGGGHANNGIRDGTEPGIAGVVLKLFAADANGHATGSILATQTADAYGYYRFDGLQPGNYVVVVDVAGSANLSGLQSSHGTSADFTLTGDAKDHGQDTSVTVGDVTGGIPSGVLTVGTGLQPTGETDLGSGSNPPCGHGPFDDANDNLVVDFSFAPTSDFFSIGHRVFNDNGAGGGTANNGIQDGTEAGISNVVVKLFADDGSGNPTGSTLDTQTTDVNGYYRFDGVAPGIYVVVVDQTNSPPLTYYLSSTGYLNDTNTAGQNYDHGKDTPVTVTGYVTNGISSVPVTVTAGSLPTGEATSGSDAGAHGPNGDSQDNLNLNFGFTPTYSIGNRVYHDPDNDGQPDLDNLDEGGFNGVHLYVFAASGGNPTGTALATTTTDANGNYRFDGLVAGSYVVVVDVANSRELSGYTNVTGWSTDTSVSGDIYDHGKNPMLGVGSVLPGGVASVPVGVGLGLQPVGEQTAAGNGANGPTGDASDNLVIDFGFAPFYSLGNRVFLDNGTSGNANNGVLDADESGVSGVVMKLFAADGSGNPTGTALATTNTDSSGYYRFDNLKWGTYVVVVDKANSPNLDGYVSSTGASTVTTVAGDKHDHGLDTLVSVDTVVYGIASTPVYFGEAGVVSPMHEPDVSTGAGANGPNGDIADNLVMDFGFATAASIAGHALVDVNGNGLFDDTLIAISGVTITLENATYEVLATTTTASDGTYFFGNLSAGDYVVVETDKAGWTSTADTTPPNDNLIPVTLAASEASTGNNFLDMQPGSIAGTVLKDVDGDGVFDGEDTTGISGVALTLQTAGGATVTTTNTASDGTYLFAGLAPGSYVVVETDSPGWASTADTDGDNDNRISVTLTSGLAATGKNFLDTPTFSIGNRVFADNGAGGGTPDNGIQDGTEAGIANVTLKLYANNSGSPSDPVLATTTTDGNGYYRFDNLRAGTYVVVMDMVASAGPLLATVPSAGAASDMTLAGDLQDHGQDTPLGGGSVLPGGIASEPVTVGIGLQPTGEATIGSGAGVNGPGGDAGDNLVVDFGFFTHFCNSGEITASWGVTNSSLHISIRDPYGLSEVRGLRFVNCTMTALAYVAGTADPVNLGSLTENVSVSLPQGTTNVVTIAIKLDAGQGASCNAQAFDACGQYSGTIDPVSTLLEIGSSGETRQTFTGILSAERFVSVQNGTPGLQRLTIILNGHVFVLSPLSDDEFRMLDVDAAMIPGADNVLVLIGEGPVGATAVILVGDSPTGNPMVMSESAVFPLQIELTALGLQLSWPETGAGLVLQNRSSLVSDESWVNWPTPPELVNGRFIVTLPATGEAQYFRLH